MPIFEIVNPQRSNRPLITKAWLESNDQGLHLVMERDGLKQTVLRINSSDGTLRRFCIAKALGLEVDKDGHIAER